ncbi:MAG TPA: RluA family pseudouridine synthase [Candidatus Nanoarchaeia archaeon]|nr:RluA family pseudouridine synthase [Candidatus Nanoarchaeia archaeon]
MEIPILYEDDNYILFNKPAGLVVHPDGKSDEPTLVDWLLKNRPDMKDVGEPLVLKSGESIPRPGIVHRLDKETSGVMVVAKNQKAFEDLKAKFQNREVEKKYHAFVYGILPEEDDTINRPIGRSKKDFRMWSAQRGARGEMREAITNYRVMEKFGDNAASAISFVEAEPKTGRTHQIRVHFKAIHHPVVSDALYAPNHAQMLGFKRHALHAYNLSFKGIDGKKVGATAPYPEDFENAIKTLKNGQGTA